MVNFSHKRDFFNQGKYDFPWRIVCVILLVSFGPSFLLGGHAEGYAAVGVTGPKNDEIENIISRLGDPSYIVRNDAESELLKIGGPAIEPLKKLLTHRDSHEPDSEILLRATRLLILIERNEHARKIREFLNGSDNKCDLAGWSEFSKIVGSGKSARKLFVGMHESQSGLVSTIDQGKDAAEKSFQDVVKRSLRISSNSNASQAFGTLTSVLFVSTIKFESESGGPFASIRYSDVDLRRIQTVLKQPQMITFINSCRSKTQVKQLISHWLDSLADHDVQPIKVKLSIITAYRLKNKLGSVVKILSQRTLPSQTRVAAVQVVCQLGNDELVPTLAKLFDDQSMVGSYLPRFDDKTLVAKNSPESSTSRQLMEVKFCDLALATAIILRQKNLADFGYFASAWVGNELVPGQAGFLSDQERRAAFEQWNQQ